MLARREHSTRELERKLGVREFGPEAIARVIGQLRREGLQSDRRFTDSYIHSRIEKGYGPSRIAMELRDKGIGAELIEELLTIREADWPACVERVREKKFGHTKPGNFREQARQARFLQYRGFSSEQIRDLFKQ
ncbi:MAG: regulatory protein RecX [Gammaproteobacteria bacterium]|nr:regulatory protein RecX [Gammaproteobacteria bacterium]